MTSPRWTLDAAPLLGVPGPHHRTRVAARWALWVVLPEEKGAGCLHVDPSGRPSLRAHRVSVLCRRNSSEPGGHNVMLSPGTYRLLATRGP